ncbi:hypothetical protein H2198_009732 [Neophaeococcomyces mojaviensis]|uniref:Uncharacterized protein n=1 Tax=Neophaeococcomyces mojaviensis TaxID=3383035 RepID=A0ACC2ZTJ8_9EURO|nr:hypothetical protein H2198_009732 [Knufia sp. JES_112]
MPSREHAASATPILQQPARKSTYKSPKYRGKWDGTNIINHGIIERTELPQLAQLEDENQQSSSAKTSRLVMRSLIPQPNQRPLFQVGQNKSSPRSQLPGYVKDQQYGTVHSLPEMSRSSIPRPIASAKMSKSGISPSTVGVLLDGQPSISQPKFGLRSTQSPYLKSPLNWRTLNQNDAALSKTKPRMQAFHQQSFSETPQTLTPMPTAGTIRQPPLSKYPLTSVLHTPTSVSSESTVNFYSDMPIRPLRLDRPFLPHSLVIEGGATSTSAGAADPSITRLKRLSTSTGIPTSLKTPFRTNSPFITRKPTTPRDSATISRLNTPTLSSQKRIEAVTLKTKADLKNRPAWSAGSGMQNLKRQHVFKLGERDWLNDSPKIDSSHIKGIADYNRPGRFKASEKTNKLAERTAQTLQKLLEDNPAYKDPMSVEARERALSKTPTWKITINGKIVDPVRLQEQNKKRERVFEKPEDNEDIMSMSPDQSK